MNPKKAKNVFYNYFDYGTDKKATELEFSIGSVDKISY